MPNPRKKYTIEEARAFAKKNPKQFNAALDKINPDPYRGTKKLADLLIKQYPERYKDYKPEDFISMLDSISKVESGNQNIAQKSINPKTKKIYDGPARGYFQIETNTAPTASKRYQNYQDILKKATAVPLPDIQVPKSGDVRSLSKDEQARLALSNMSATAASRKQSLNPLNSQDSWLNYHWNGSETEKPARQSHWKETFGFANGGIIPISNPSGKQTVNRFREGGEAVAESTGTRKYINKKLPVGVANFNPLTEVQRRFNKESFEQNPVKRIKEDPEMGKHAAARYEISDSTIYTHPGKLPKNAEDSLSYNFAETPHAKQLKEMGYNKMLGQMLIDHYSYPKSEQYNVPGTIENDAHSIKGIDMKYDYLQKIMDYNEKLGKLNGKPINIDSEALRIDLDNGSFLPTPNLRFKDGGKIKPYITNDPKDPRIQAYRDSSDLYSDYRIQQELLKTQNPKAITNHHLDYSKNKSLQDSINSNKPDFYYKPRDIDNLIINQWKRKNNPNIKIIEAASPEVTHSTIKPKGVYMEDIENGLWNSTDTQRAWNNDYSNVKPIQPVIYQKPQSKETSKTIGQTWSEKINVPTIKPKAKPKPIQQFQDTVVVPQVTPESQTQINTGKEDTTKLGFRTDSTGKRHYRVNGKDVPDSVYKKYEALKHKKVEYGLGGTIGSLLQAAAPVAGLIPGVGTLVGAAAGVVGNGLQQLDSGQKWDPTQTIGAGIQGATGMKVPGKMAQGGMTGLVPVNVEGYDVNSISMAKAKKGELLVNNGNVIKNYISRPPHPERGQNPLGDDLVQPGSIVIPKNRSQEYLNAGRALRKQIEASVVSQQVAREGNMMRKGGQAGRSKMLPGGMAKDYFDREYPYAPSLNPHVGYAQVEQGGNHYMEGDAYRNARAGLPASYNNMSPMTPRDPFNSGYGQNLRTQMSNQGDVSNPYGQGTPEEGDEKPKMSPFDKLNLGQFGLSMIPAIGDIIDMTASVQTPQFGSLRNVSPNLIDPNTGQSQINQAYRSGYNSLRDSGVYSLKSNRNLVADRMQRSGDQALNIANQNTQIKNQFVGMNTDINKYNLDMQNQVELYRMQGQAKRREARRNLLDRAPAAASQYMQNGLYAKMLGI